MIQSYASTLVASQGSQTAFTANSTGDLAPACDFTFAPNYFQFVGQKFVIKAQGILSTTTGSNTMTFSVQLGSTTINAALGAITFIASQTNMRWSLELMCETVAIGATTATTFKVSGWFLTNTAVLAVTSAMLPATGALTAGTGVDCTASQKLSLQGIWSAVSNSLTVEQYEVISLL